MPAISLEAVRRESSDCVADGGMQSTSCSPRYQLGSPFDFGLAVSYKINPRKIYLKMNPKPPSFLILPMRTQVGQAIRLPRIAKTTPTYEE
jgi:hypothetical protein